MKMEKSQQTTQKSKDHERPLWAIICQKKKKGQFGRNGQNSLPELKQEK